MTLAAGTVKPIADDVRQTIQAALEQDARARDWIADATASGVGQVYLVGCGGSLVVMYPTQYLLERDIATIPTFLHTSAEFVRRRPAALGPASLVIASSHTGTTPETLDAVHLAREAGARVAVVTRLADSPLGRAAEICFAYGSRETVMDAKHVLIGQIVAALRERLDVPDDYPALRKSWEALPDALYAAREEAEAMAADAAARLNDAPLVYVLAAGPSYGVGYGLAMCYFQEMQWMHAAAVNAGEFFHGAFEAISEETPVVLLLDEAETRPIAERALAFVARYSRNVVVLDSRELSMPGVDGRHRALVSPLALGAATSRVAAHLAAVRQHPLETRRYMFHVDY
jgi:fructoselysine 6-phosphate deglycase